MFQARRPNRWLIILTSSVVFLLWLGALLAFTGRLLPARPSPFDTRSVVESRDWQGGPGARLGANLDLTELSGSRLDETLAALSQGGFRWVRFTAPWDSVEPQRGSYDWAPLDTVFAALERYPDLEPVVVLNRAPEWARRTEDAENPLAPPRERADFGTFAASVSGRYGDQLRYYQIWDEPNIAPHWGARPADPADYAGLLREGATQVRGRDPDAVILLAALAPTIERGGANLSDLDYLDALYGLQAQRWFDVVAAEPYGFSEPPAAVASADRLNFGRVALVRDVMARHGQANAPLWATVFGWNALPEEWSGPSSPWGQVSEAEQATYAGEALNLAATEWGWLGPMFWAAACPQRAPDDPWRGFALCDGAEEPRSVWRALTEKAQQRPTMPPGDYAPDHPAVAYDPGWRVTPSAADPSETGDTLSLSFNGTGAALRVEGGPYWGLYRVRVDGEPANALPRDASGEAYLVLYDPLSETRLAPVAEGLAPGVHRLELTAEGGWGQWALQGFRIYGAPVFASTVWAWGLLALAGLGTILWAALAWPTVARRGARALDVAASGPEPFYWLAAAGLVALLTLGRGTVMGLAALAGLGFLWVVRPDVSLPFIAFSLPFWPRPVALMGREFSLYELLVWIGVLGMAAHLALRWLTSDASPKGPAGLDWPVLAFVGIGLVATLPADHRDVALREFRTVLLDGALFYLLVTRAPSPRRRIFSPWPLIAGLMVGAAAVSALALWQLATGQGRIDVEGVWRVRALYGSPNNLALYLDRIVPLALALAVFGASGLTSRSHAAIRAAFGLTAVLTGLACLLTFSKGAWLLGLPVGISFVLLGGAWRSGRRWPIALWTGLAVLGLAALALAARTPRMAGLFNLRSGTSFLRVQLWSSAWRMALDHPLLGVGPDNFLYAYRTRYVLPGAWEELNLNHPHNVVLDAWTRLGLAGLAALAWLLIAGWRRGWGMFRSAPADVWPLALGLLAGVAAALAHGLIDNSFFLVDLMALLMLAMGLFQRLSTIESPFASSLRPPVAGHYAGTAV